MHRGTNVMNAQQAISQITGIITQIIGVGLLILILAAVLARYGIRVPQLPAASATELAWLAGAWWLYRGGKL